MIEPLVMISDYELPAYLTPTTESPKMPLVTVEQVKAHLEGKFTNPDSRADYVAMIIAHLVNFPTGSFTTNLRDAIIKDAAQAEANLQPTA